jgi:hypothetical protein
MISTAILCASTAFVVTVDERTTIVAAEPNLTYKSASPEPPEAVKLMAVKRVSIPVFG